MKSVVSLLALLFLGIGAYAQTQKADSINVLKVIEKMSDRFDIKFAFDHAALEQEKILWHMDSIGLNQSLDQLTDQLDYRYELQDSVVLIIPNPTEVRKNIGVTGLVVDQETGEPLPNAVVQLPGSGKYTITNQDGRFSFVNVPYDTSAIVVKYLGYNLERLTARSYENGERMNIQLTSSPEYLKDVVISEMAYKVIKINKDISHISLDLKEFNGLTNFGEPDVFRSVQLLPGVSATNETSSGLVIRGGTPEQNLVLFDGFTVFHLDHFFGIYSAFNSNVIKDVQLYKSGYGARWGTRVSGVMDITGKSGNSQKPSGNIGVNLVSANAVAEVPLGDKTSVVLAARRAYTDIIQSSLYKKLFDHLQSNDLKGSLIDGENISDEPVQSDFYFYDINAKVTHQLSDKDIIQASYYQGKDDLRQSNSFAYEIDEPEYYLSEEIDTREHTKWGNRGGSISYGRQWHDRLYTKGVISGSNFFKDQDYLQTYEFVYDSLEGEVTDDYSFPFRNENQVEELAIRLNAEVKLNDRNIIDGGVYGVFSHVRYQNFYYSSLEDTDLDINDSGSIRGLFGQYTYLPNSRLSLTGGVRLTDYSLTSDIYVEPRLSMSYSLNQIFTVKGSMGKYYQYAVNVSSQNPTFNDGNFWLMGGVDGIPLLESRHYVLGVNINHHLFEIDLEGYYKKTDGLTDYIFVADDQGYYELFSTGKGEIYGLDFMIKKNAGPYTGWLAYSLSENRNLFEGINNDDWYASDLDERHELKWVNLLKVKNWEFSMTWLYGSGRPYSIANSQSTAPDSVYFEFSANIDNPNTKRIPAYHKMDIGISYLQKLKFGQLRYGLNLLNVYNRRNIKYIRESSTPGIGDNTSFTQNVELLGFTPSIFINFSF